MLKKVVVSLLLVVALILVGCSNKEDIPKVEAPEQLQDGVTESNESEKSGEGGETSPISFSDTVGEKEEKEEQVEGIKGANSNSIGFSGSKDTESIEGDGQSSVNVEEENSSSKEIKREFTGTIVDAGIEDGVAMFMVDNPEGSIVFIVNNDTMIEDNASNVNIGSVVKVGYNGELLEGNPPHAYALNVEAVEVEE